MLDSDAEALAEAAFAAGVPAPALKQGFTALSRLPLRATDRLKTVGLRLAEVLKAQGDLGFILQLLDALPKQSVGLAEFAAEMTRYALDQVKSNNGDEGSIGKVAGLANNLANRLSDLGQREAALEAAREPVDLYCELSRQRPDAFTPNLATSPGTLDQILRSDASAKARDCFAEGIELLTPVFLRYPAGLASQMGWLAQEYLATVEHMNETPNEALLAPVVEVFKQLQANEETQG